MPVRMRHVEWGKAVQGEEVPDREEGSEDSTFHCGSGTR
jgi:hypothetical protein